MPWCNCVTASADVKCNSDALRLSQVAEVAAGRGGEPPTKGAPRRTVFDRLMGPRPLRLSTSGALCFGLLVGLNRRAKAEGAKCCQVHPDMRLIPKNVHAPLDLERGRSSRLE